MAKDYRSCSIGEMRVTPLRVLCIVGLLFIGWGSVDSLYAAGGNSPGRLDRTFDGDGKVTTDFSGQNDEVYDLAIQPDGKIAAAGYATIQTDGKIVVAGASALARYHADGTLDTSFGNGGAAGIFFGQANGLALQSDGKWIVAGTDNHDFLVTRVNIDGTLDSTFGTNGVAASIFTTA